MSVISTIQARCTSCDEDVTIDQPTSEDFGSWDSLDGGGGRFYLDDPCEVCQAEEAYRNSFEGKARELSKAWDEVKQALRHATRSSLKLLKRFHHRG